jgi:hypothetical protein
VPIAVKYRPSESLAFGVGYQFSFLPSSSEETDVKTNGIFLDVSGKTGKSIYGIRVTKFGNDLMRTDKLINFSAYLGIGLF